MNDIDRIKSDLSERALSFCQYLFPAGKRTGGEYCVGSLRGEPGNSLKIRLTGNKIGLWKDFATGESGNNLLDLLCEVRRGDFHSACEEATNWLGHTSGRSAGKFKSFVKAAWNNVKTRYFSNDSNICPFQDLEDGTAQDYNTLSQSLGINVEGLLLANEDGILKFFNHYINGRCWSVVNKNNLVRQDRRLDGKQFLLKNGQCCKSRTIGSPTYLIGLPTDKPIILLVEGSTDLLAAYSLVGLEDLRNEISPVAVLGASNIIHHDELEHFKGKYVLGFPDYDKSGIAGMTCWQNQLQRIVKSFRIFDYCSLLRDDGKKINDLRDFLRVHIDHWESSSEVRSPLGHFIMELFSEEMTYGTD